MEVRKIKNFTDLDAWKEGHKLVLLVYEVTRTFPREEIFALVNQMRRCVVSVTSNIAEGFGRQSSREKVQFYSISQGSVAELQNQLIIARDLHYLISEKFLSAFDQAVKVHKITGGLIKSVRQNA